MGILSHVPPGLYGIPAGAQSGWKIVCNILVSVPKGRTSRLGDDGKTRMDGNAHLGVWAVRFQASTTPQSGVKSHEMHFRAKGSFSFQLLHV